jgi:hypothetical protein
VLESPKGPAFKTSTRWLCVERARGSSTLGERLCLPDFVPRGEGVTPDNNNDARHTLGFA